MIRGKVNFTFAQKTSLTCLHARALQNRWPDPILPDPWADAAREQVEYDLKRELRRWQIVAIASRAATFDLYTRQYLAGHPDATVVHLGCGLDSRIYRIDPPSSVRWFDVDYPEVIDLHRLLYPERAGYQRIGANLEDGDWLGALPEHTPCLILAEGLLMYLSGSRVGPLLQRIIERFERGELVFDAINEWEATHASPTGGVEYRWWLGDPRDLCTRVQPLELIEEVATSRWVGFWRNPLAIRLLVRALDQVGAMRINRIVRYRF